MSLIKNAYVCVVNGEPELFQTQQQAEDLPAAPRHRACLRTRTADDLEAGETTQSFFHAVNHGGNIIFSGVGRGADKPVHRRKPGATSVP